MRARADAADPVLGPKADWSDLLVASLSPARDFIDLRQDTRLLRRHIEDAPLREPLAFPYTAEARTIRHRDEWRFFPRSARSSQSCSHERDLDRHRLAGRRLCADDGGVGCCLFAAQDDPAPSIMYLANASIISAIGAAIYLFAMLPRRRISRCSPLLWLRAF